MCFGGTGAASAGVTAATTGALGATGVAATGDATAGEAAWEATAAGAIGASAFGAIGASAFGATGAGVSRTASTGFASTAGATATEVASSASGAPTLPAFLATAFLGFSGSGGCSARVSPSRSALRRTRSACGSSMLDEWLLTPMPSATERSSVSLFVIPSSLASSWSRMFFGKTDTFHQPFKIARRMGASCEPVGAWVRTHSRTLALACKISDMTSR